MATNYCEKYITSDIVPDCANPLVKGVQREAVIINRADIEKITRDTSNSAIITALQLKSGKKGYKVIQLGKKPFNGTTTALQASDNGNAVNKVVTIRIVDAGPEISQNILSPLLNSDFVVVLRNNFVGADGKAKYEVLGAEQGLSVTAFDNDKYGEDPGYIIALTEEAAPTPAIYLWSESEQATDSLVASLTDAAAATASIDEGGDGDGEVTES